MAESSEAAARSDVETEKWLDQMLTQLAFCDDFELEALLSKLLPRTISSLSFESPAICKTVLEILDHVKKRVEPQPEIGLPLMDLWKMYSELNASPMVKNFSIIYIKMAFERINLKEKENMAPMLLANISKLPQQHQEIIMRMVVKVIGECHASHIHEEVAAKYRELNDPQDKELFLDFCLHVILYQPPSQGGGCPPGLSLAQANRVTEKLQLKGDLLMKRKLGILNVIETMELALELIYPLYLAACADSEELVFKRGEELLRRKASTTNLEDPRLINKLFLLFNGTTGAENVAPESRVSPGNASLKMKLMAVFCQSITAANSIPSNLQCIFGCILGSGTNSRLRQLGTDFTVWVFNHAKSDELERMGPVMLDVILKLLDCYSNSESDSIAKETRIFCFQAIDLMAQCLPQRFRDKIDMAVWLFDAPKAEAHSVRVIIQEATNSLAAAYVDKGDFNMTEPGQSSEAKNPSFSSGDDDEIVESDVELDNSDVVKPDNDPPQKMGDPSVEVTKEKRIAAESENLKAFDAISEGKLDEAIDYLTEAIMLNPISDILYATRASVFVKLNKPNAAIRDANAAFEINPDSAKGYKIRGMANAMLGCWEEAANDLRIASNLGYDEEIGSVLKKVEPNVQKIEEHRKKYERLQEEREIKGAECERQRQKAEQDQGAFSAFNDGQVIGIHSTSELETELNAATKTSRLAILYFTAQQCLPSIIMSPFYTSLAAKYPEVVFLKVDLDEARDVIERCNISSFPTFLFIRNGNAVDEVVGSNKGALERKTAQYAIQSFLDKL